MDYVSGCLLSSLLMVYKERKDHVSSIDEENEKRTNFGGYIRHFPKLEGRMKKRDSERKSRQSLNTQPLPVTR